MRIETINSLPSASSPATPGSPASKAGRNEHKTVSSWFRSLPLEKREAIRRFHRIKPVYHITVLGHLLMWAGACLTMHFLPVWPTRLAGYVFIGFILHGLANLMHEGIHGNLFRKPTLDRWFSFAFGAPVLISASAYRVIHLLHHRYNRASGDPDELTNVSGGKAKHQILFFVWVFIGMYLYVVRLPWKAIRLASPHARKQVLTEYALLSVAYAGVAFCALRFAFFEDLLHCWLLPGVFTGLFANVRGWAEHVLTSPGHPLTQTRTVTSNKLLSYLNVNLNYHLEHHLFPAIPWYTLPRVHQLLQKEYQQAGAFVHTSYLLFLCKAARAGVHGVVRQR